MPGREGPATGQRLAAFVKGPHYRSNEALLAMGVTAAIKVSGDSSMYQS